jgi:hypothetical protein
MTLQYHSSRFQANFDQHGDIRTSRIPLDPSVIIWAKDRPWFPVYKGFYILCKNWNNTTYLGGRKYQLARSNFEILTKSCSVCLNNEDGQKALFQALN